jgi:hypothetical protein
MQRARKRHPGVESPARHPYTSKAVDRGFALPLEYRISQVVSELAKGIWPAVGLSNQKRATFHATQRQPRSMLPYLVALFTPA